MYALILQAPNPQNGQTHSNNSSAHSNNLSAAASLSVFDHFVRLALKGLKLFLLHKTSSSPC